MIVTPEVPAHYTLADVAMTVAFRHRFTVEELRGTRRFKPLSWARHEAVYLMRSIRREDGKPKYTLNQIGRFMSGRNHKTLINSINKYRSKHGLPYV